MANDRNDNQKRAGDPAEFQEPDFGAQQLACPACKWQGSGADAVLIDFYGLAKEKEVHCPECDQKLGTLKAGDSSGEAAGGPGFPLD